jgi:ssDNA-binding Zn-finger/Zn-ribbon topoisomerase 1
MSDLIFISEHPTDEVCPECEGTLLLSQGDGETPSVGCDCCAYLVA